MGIIQRLVQNFIIQRHEAITIVLACRNRQKAQETRLQLLSELFTGSLRNLGEKCLEILLVDLASTKSVFQACQEFKKR